MTRINTTTLPSSIGMVLATSPDPVAEPATHHQAVVSSTTFDQQYD